MIPGSTEQELDAFLAAHRPMDSGASFAAGDMLADWRITAFLGRGGSGEVYRAVHVTLGTAVALKIYVPRTGESAPRDASARARFLREAKLLAENRHPAFPRFLGSGVWNGRPWYVMELLEPLSLPAEDKAVAALLTGVATGIAYLHSMGLVHRDIKPGNIMRRGDGSPVLIDLGLVKDIEAQPGHAGDSLSVIDGKAVAVGTPRYAAPEQLNGGEITAATDVYALGMLANECFGEHPPRAWRHIIRNATAALPEQRYPSVAVFARAVRHRNWQRNLAWCLGLIVAVGVMFWLMASLVCERTGAGGKDSVAHESTEGEKQTLADLWNEVQDMDRRMSDSFVTMPQEERKRWLEGKRDDAARRYVALERNIRDLTSEGGGAVGERSRLATQSLELLRRIQSVTQRELDKMLLFDVAANNSRKVDPPFAFDMRLNGKRLTFRDPVVLESGKTYSVVGPGTLDADISGPSNAVLRLKDCVVLNRTKSLFPENGLRYELENGVYLNFINIRKEPLDWGRRVRGACGIYDGAFNDVRCGGPETLEELEGVLLSERSAIMMRPKH